MYKETRTYTKDEFIVNPPMVVKSTVLFEMLTHSTRDEDIPEVWHYSVYNETSMARKMFYHGKSYLVAIATVRRFLDVGEIPNADKLEIQFSDY